MSGFWKPGSSVPGGGERGDESVQLFDHNLSHLPLDAQRRSLPIFRHKSSILYALKKHRTIVIVGETGCGKTTQIPQYLHEAGWTAGGRAVVCTQPRRVAALTVATRVAEEMGSQLGAAVGYAVRFDSS